MVLILVLVVIAVLSLSALTFSELMLVEREAAQLSGRQVQALAAAESGVQMARLFLAWDEESLYEAGGWYDNPEQFSGVLVVDDELPRQRCRFSFVAPNTEQGGVRFGLEDESARLNLNALLLLEQYAKSAGVENGGRQVLMGLPGMTEEIADAILDWIDSDDETREFGAELDYYTSLDPPYAPKNGPLETVEELLLVRDVSPWLLFGGDANRNGQIDQTEQDPAEMSGVDNSDGSMDRGWAAYLTLYSLEANRRTDGEAKIDVNQDDLETLYDELVEVLDEQWATFIVALRRYGPSDSTEAGETEYTLTTILDLIGAKVQVQQEQQGSGEGAGQGQTAGESKILESPFTDTPGVMSTYLPTLMDNLTANPAELLPARININQASSAVLAGIPGMTSEILDQIITQRQPDPATAESYCRNETWILCDGIVTLDQMKALMPFVTAGGNVFRAQVVGYFDQQGPSARIEVVLDASTSPARVVFWRDISHLGRGYSQETLGIEAPDW